MILIFKDLEEDDGLKDEEGAEDGTKDDQHETESRCLESEDIVYCNQSRSLVPQPIYSTIDEATQDHRWSGEYNNNLQSLPPEKNFTAATANVSVGAAADKKNGGGGGVTSTGGGRHFQSLPFLLNQESYGESEELVEYASKYRPGGRSAGRTSGHPGLTVAGQSGLTAAGYPGPTAAGHPGHTAVGHPGLSSVAGHLGPTSLAPPTSQPGRGREEEENLFKSLQHPLHSEIRGGGDSGRDSVSSSGTLRYMDSCPPSSSSTRPSPSHSSSPFLTSHPPSPFSNGYPYKNPPAIQSKPTRASPPYQYSHSQLPNRHSPSSTNGSRPGSDLRTDQLTYPSPSVDTESSNQATPPVRLRGSPSNHASTRPASSHGRPQSKSMSSPRSRPGSRQDMVDVPSSNSRVAARPVRKSTGRLDRTPTKAQHSPTEECSDIGSFAGAFSTMGGPSSSSRHSYRPLSYHQDSGHHQLDLSSLQHPGSLQQLDSLDKQGFFQPMSSLHYQGSFQQLDSLQHQGSFQQLDNLQHQSSFQQLDNIKHQSSFQQLDSRQHQGSFQQLDILQHKSNFSYHQQLDHHPDGSSQHDNISYQGGKQAEVQETNPMSSKEATSVWRTDRKDRRHQRAADRLDKEDNFSKSVPNLLQEYSNGRKEEQELEPATVERLGPVGEAGGGAKPEEAGARLSEVGSCLPEDPPGYFTFLDPGKRVRVSEEEIKQIQKRAVIDYYRRLKQMKSSQDLTSAGRTLKDAVGAKSVSQSSLDVNNLTTTTVEKSANNTDRKSPNNADRKSANNEKAGKAEQRRPKRNRSRNKLIQEFDLNVERIPTPEPPPPPEYSGDEVVCDDPLPPPPPAVEPSLPSPSLPTSSLPPPSTEGRNSHDLPNTSENHTKRSSQANEEKRKDRVLFDKVSPEVSGRVPDRFQTGRESPARAAARKAAGWQKFLGSSNQATNQTSNRDTPTKQTSNPTGLSNQLYPGSANQASSPDHAMTGPQFSQPASLPYALTSQSFTSLSSASLPYTSVASMPYSSLGMEPRSSSCRETTPEVSQEQGRHSHSDSGISSLCGGGGGGRSLSTASLSTALSTSSSLASSRASCFSPLSILSSSSSGSSRASLRSGSIVSSCTIPLEEEEEEYSTLADLKQVFSVGEDYELEDLCRQFVLTFSPNPQTSLLFGVSHAALKTPADFLANIFEPEDLYLQPHNYQISGDMRGGSNEESPAVLKGRLHATLQHRASKLAQHKDVMRREGEGVDRIRSQLLTRLKQDGTKSQVRKLEVSIEETERICLLLVSLASRLAKLHNSVTTSQEEGEDRETCRKEEKLIEQLREAEDLKGSVDKRNSAVHNILLEVLGDQFSTLHTSFTKARTQLILNQRLLADRIQTTEQQLSALANF